LRIAVVTPEYPPDSIGGGGIVYAALSERFALSHQVRVFSGNDKIRGWLVKRSARTDESGVTVLSYPLVPVFRRNSSLRTVLPPGPWALRALLRDLLEWNPDVAHLHGLGYLITDICAAILHWKKIPYIITNHGLPISFNDRGKSARLAYTIYHRTLLSHTVACASVATAVSFDEASKCIATFGRDFRVVPNGISELPTSEEPVKLPFRLPREPFIAVAGRFASNKGYENLVAALSQLPNPPTCIIAGDWHSTELGRMLHDRLSPHHFIMPGTLSRSQLRLVFSNSSAVVVPSLTEPFGLVGFEALAAGARVISTSTGGLFENAEPGAPVIFVEPGNTDELASAIEEVVNLGPPSEIENAASTLTLSRLNWENVTSQYQALLYSAISHAE
jgi:1,4-alpha-glucan branching enzyme